MSSTANDLTLLEAVVTMPRVGIWHADLVVDTDDPTKLTGAVAVSLVEGALVLAGTTWRDAALWRGTTRARIVGGAAGFRSQLLPTALVSTTATTIVRGILADAGEVMSATVDPAILDVDVDGWTRLACSGGAALQDIVDELGATWRVLPDGTVWIGTETWPVGALADYAILDHHVENAMMLLGVEFPTLLPGTTFEGAHVGRVVHRLGGDKVRTDVYFE